jgi:DNA-binding PadR family transcriptional regulator
MALGQAILICLADGPLTGYELAKTFDTSIGFFWHADHQQIYRELKRLESGNLVTAELVVQTGRPNKSIYSITDTGRERLRTWSDEKSPPLSIKDDMMVKLYGLDHVDIDHMIDHISERFEKHKQLSKLYERIAGTTFSDVDPKDAGRVGKLLGLRLGILYEAMWIEWCEDALKRLANVKA